MGALDVRWWGLDGGVWGRRVVRRWLLGCRGGDADADDALGLAQLTAE